MIPTECPAEGNSDGSGSGTGSGSGSTGGDTGSGDTGSEPTEPNDGGATDGGATDGGNTGSGDSGSGTGGDSGTGSGSGTDSGSGSGSTDNGTTPNDGPFVPETCTCLPKDEFVAIAEGYRNCVYLDQVGVPTIGIGFNLWRWNVDFMFDTFITSGTKAQVIAGDVCLTDKEIMDVFNWDMNTWVIPEGDKCIVDRASHPPCVQTVFEDMVFNLGGPNFCGWTSLINAFNSHNYEAAAVAMYNSNWCNIVQTRCWRNAEIMRSCIA